MLIHDTSPHIHPYKCLHVKALHLSCSLFAQLCKHWQIHSPPGFKSCSSTTFEIQNIRSNFCQGKKRGRNKTFVHTQKGDLKCLNLFITRYSLHCVCSDFCRYFVIKIFRTPKTTKTGVTRHN